jgi:four helix bundle protein
VYLVEKERSLTLVVVARTVTFFSGLSNSLGKTRGTKRAHPFIMTIQTYRDLETWQACMDAVEHTYRLARKFPDYERFALAGQMHRGSVSMPSNVAEGWARHSTKVYMNHVDIAIGSHAELETCAEVARRLKYVSDSEWRSYMTPLDRAGQLLNGLFRSLDASERRR